MASFGMMNEAYFVGKNVLLDWVNNFLEINLDKVEQCASGAVYCNLWDAIHPGTMPMSRVDFTVKHEYDYHKNWKLLQNGFQKAAVEKMIPVQRLVKARYQDNLEFLQWMYKYCRDTYNGDPDDPTYDAVARRSKSKGGKDYTGSSSNGRRRPNRPARPTSAVNRGNPSRYRAGGTQSQRGSTVSQNSSVGGTMGGGARRGGSGNSNQDSINKSNQRELEELRNENKRLTETSNAAQTQFDALQAEHNELSNIAKDIEKERDFYFHKVIAIEQILKKEEPQDTPLLTKVYALLYKTEEEQAQEKLTSDVRDENVQDSNIIEDAPLGAAQSLSPFS